LLSVVAENGVFVTYNGGVYPFKTMARLDADGYGATARSPCRARTTWPPSSRTWVRDVATATRTTALLFKLHPKTKEERRQETDDRPQQPEGYANAFVTGYRKLWGIS
jgi:hypothetical protein